MGLPNLRVSEPCEPPCEPCESRESWEPFFSSIGLGGRRSFHKQTNLNLATKVLHENSLISLRLPELLLLGQILNVGGTS